MGNIVELPNITFASVQKEESKNFKKESNFDVKNYLNVRLEPNEVEKTIAIRLLPMDLETGNPFVFIHTHNVEVPKAMVKNGQKPYKSYICLRTKDIDHEKYGTRCPLCEINQRAYKEAMEETDPIKAKELKELSLKYKTYETVICRCIERGKENEGVKFWKFNIRKDKADPYNQIIKLMNLRKESAERKGKIDNILDLYEGRDLNLTIRRIEGEGVPAPPTIVDDSDRSPITNDMEQLKAWIYDAKKWQDVFTCKPYEYLELIGEKKVPFFDNEKSLWVEDTRSETCQENVSKANDAIANAQAKIAEMTVNEKAEPKPIDANFIGTMTVNDDDLPF